MVLFPRERHVSGFHRALFSGASVHRVDREFILYDFHAKEMNEVRSGNYLRIRQREQSADDLLWIFMEVYQRKSEKQYRK